MSVDTAREQQASTPDAPKADEAAVAILEIGPEALQQVLDARSTEDKPEEYALRVEIEGSRGVDFLYILEFERIDELPPGEERMTFGDLSVSIPADTIPLLRGSVLDVAKVGGGLVIRNPNRPDPMAGLNLELTGDLPEKVQQLLEQSINPSLAEHGGFASLVGVDGTRVFITMGGGCQGCNMSQMTLVEGIQRTIIGAIPEVTEVVDATDHASGENPYF